MQQIQIKTTEQDTEKVLKKSLNWISRFEGLSLKMPLFGKLYRKVFYERMVRNEIEHAHLSRGMSIAHIGSGPYPITAMEIAKTGCRVDCYDIDRRAVKQSSAYIRQKGLQHFISVYDCSQKQYLDQNYEAVFVSFHITGKEEILEMIVQSLKKKSKLIYRNPAGLLRIIFKEHQPRVDESVAIERIKQPFFKESVIIRKVRDTQENV